MAYASVEYEFWCNPKIRAAGKDAALLYIAANGYCNQFMTDGFILDESIDAIAALAFQRNPNKAVDALVENGLWHRVNGGYEVHDYLKYNKSKAQIESLSEKRSNAGKAGADMRNKSSEDATANAKHLPEQLNGSILYTLKDKESTTTTVPPSDFQLFAEVYELVTGSEPKVLNAEIEAVGEIIKAGGTPDDFRKALQGMQDKDYTIASMASALTWTLKDIEKRKQPVRPNKVARKSTSSDLDEILDGAPIFAEDKK